MELPVMYSFIFVAPGFKIFLNRVSLKLTIGIKDSSIECAVGCTHGGMIKRSKLKIALYYFHHPLDSYLLVDLLIDLLNRISAEEFTIWLVFLQ